MMSQVPPPTSTTPMRTPVPGGLACSNVLLKLSKFLQIDAQGTVQVKQLYVGRFVVHPLVSVLKLVVALQNVFLCGMDFGCAL